MFHDVQLSIPEQMWMERSKELITKRGIFAYSLLDCSEKLNVTSPPTQADFYNTLTEEELKDEKHEHVLKCLSPNLG